MWFDRDANYGVFYLIWSSLQGKVLPSLSTSLLCQNLRVIFTPLHPFTLITSKPSGFYINIAPDNFLLCSHCFHCYQPHYMEQRQVSSKYFFASSPSSRLSATQQDKLFFLKTKQYLLHCLKYSNGTLHYQMTFVHTFYYLNKLSSPHFSICLSNVYL